MRPRRIRTDLFALTALCAVVFGLGLTTMGLGTFDESINALGARRMQESDQRLVAIVAGEPAIDIAPLLPWLQVGLADLLGRRSGELELRLIVAVAGWLGVISTFLVTRRLLTEPGADARQRAFADQAAWWSALVLLTCLLFVRATRVGEPQILLVAPTVIGIGALHAAWRAHIRRHRISFGAVTLAIACACVCALATGPGGLITLVFGGYAGVIIAQLSGKDRIGGSTSGGLLKALARTSPLLVILVPVFVLWLWGRAVAAQAGATGALQALTAFEHALTVNAIIRAVVTLVIGGGLASLICVLGVHWLVHSRARLPAGLAFVVGWIVGPLIAIGVLTDGSARWLVPMWPGLAMFAGACVAAVSRERWGVWVQRVLYAGVIALAGTQAWWYGFERERRHANRSPRAFVRELLRPEHSVQPQRLATLGFWSPALDFYVDHDVVPVESAWRYPRSVMSLEELVIGLRDNRGTITMLVRDARRPSDQGDVERLVRLGLAVQTIPLEAEWLIDEGRARVRAVRVWSP